MHITRNEADVEVTNWDGSIVSRPRALVTPETAEDIVAVMRDAERYPAPVRAIGSNHSSTRCTVADGGTMVDMRGMNRVLSIEGDRVTVQAGALYFDVAQELAEHGLQFHVNLEIGSLSLGTAATGGTKDSSMPGEFGQVSSYAIGMKLVRPSGELFEVTEDQPELLKIMRSSYGLLGIVYEVTFRVMPLRTMTLDHVTYTLAEFEAQLDTLRSRGDSMFMYVTPFLDTITVEFRQYTDEPPSTAGKWTWRLRNYFWKTVAPYVGYATSKYLGKGLRYFIVDTLNRFQTFVMHTFVSGRTVATDQIIRFPPTGGKTQYRFSIWAFPESSFPRIMREYFEFCRSYYAEHGYRCNMLNVGYRIAQDESNHFSYSYDGGVMTVDPVSTGDSGWEDFLVAYNAFCSERGGRPLFNQTRSLTPAQARAAFGDKLDAFEEIRKEYDPTDRLLNAYFAGMLAPVRDGET